MPSKPSDSFDLPEKKSFSFDELIELQQSSKGDRVAAKKVATPEKKSFSFDELINNQDNTFTDEEVVAAIQSTPPPEKTFLQKVATVGRAISSFIPLTPENLKSSIPTSKDAARQQIEIVKGVPGSVARGVTDFAQGVASVPILLAGQTEAAIGDLLGGQFKKAGKRFTSSSEDNLGYISKGWLDKRRQTGEYLNEYAINAKPVMDEKGEVIWDNLDPSNNPAFYANMIAENVPTLAIQLGGATKVFQAVRLAGGSEKVAAKLAAQFSAKIGATQSGAGRFQEKVDKGVGVVEALGEASASAAITYLTSAGVPGPYGKKIGEYLSGKGKVGQMAGRVFEDGLDAIFFKSALGGPSGWRGRLEAAGTGALTEMLQEGSEGVGNLVLDARTDPAVRANFGKRLKSTAVVHGVGGLLMGSVAGAALSGGGKLTAKEINLAEKVGKTYENLDVARADALKRLEEAYDNTEAAHSTGNPELIKKAKADLDHADRLANAVEDAYDLGILKGVEQDAVQVESTNEEDARPGTDGQAVGEGDPGVRQGIEGQAVAQEGQAEVAPADRRTEPQPVAQEQRTDEDRRTEKVVRKSVDEMSPDERLEEIHRLRKELRTSRKAGIPNEMALEEHVAEGRAKFVAYADMDNLKTINDKHGHHMGDAAVKAYGDFLDRMQKEFNATRPPEEQVDIFHKHGDEFIATSAHPESEQSLQDFFDYAQEKRKVEKFSGESKGEITTLELPGISYGAAPLDVIGDGDEPSGKYRSAESRMHEHKARRAAAGERTLRNSEPADGTPGVVRQEPQLEVPENRGQGDQQPEVRSEPGLEQTQEQGQAVDQPQTREQALDDFVEGVQPEATVAPSVNPNAPPSSDTGEVTLKIKGRPEVVLEHPDDITAFKRAKSEYDAEMARIDELKAADKTNADRYPDLAESLRGQRRIMRMQAAADLKAAKELLMNQIEAGYPGRGLPDDIRGVVEWPASIPVSDPTPPPTGYDEFIGWARGRMNDMRKAVANLPAKLVRTPGAVADYFKAFRDVNTAAVNQFDEMYKNGHITLPVGKATKIGIVGTPIIPKAQPAVPKVDDKAGLYNIGSPHNRGEVANQFVADALEAKQNEIMNTGELATVLSNIFKKFDIFSASKDLEKRLTPFIRLFVNTHKTLKAAETLVEKLKEKAVTNTSLEIADKLHNARKRLGEAKADASRARRLYEGRIKEAAHEHADVRVALLADYVGNMEKAPAWLLAIAHTNEIAAAAEFSEVMKRSGEALNRVGIDTIREAYVMHTLGPLLKRGFNQKSDTVKTDYSFLHREGTMNLFPSIHAIAGAYVPIVSKKIAMQPLLDRYEVGKNGDASYIDKLKEVGHENAASFLNKTITEMQNPRETDTLDSVIDMARTYYYYKLIGLNIRVAFRHSLKFANQLIESPQTAAQGIKQGLKAKVMSSKKGIGKAIAEGRPFTDAEKSRMLMNHFASTKMLADSLADHPLENAWKTPSNTKRFLSLLSRVTGEPVSTVEAFENRTDLFSSLLRGHKAGMKAGENASAALTKILDLNFRGGVDTPDWIKSKVGRTMFMFAQTPLKVGELQLKFIRNGMKGGKDVYGSSESAKMVRQVIVLGAIAKYFGTDMVMQMVHWPVFDMHVGAEYLGAGANALMGALSSGEDREKHYKKSAEDYWAGRGNWKGLISTSPVLETFEEVGKISDTLVVGGPKEAGKAWLMTTSGAKQIKSLVTGVPPEGYERPIDYITGTKTEAAKVKARKDALKKGRILEKAAKRAIGPSKTDIKAANEKYMKTLRQKRENGKGSK